MLPPDTSINSHTKLCCLIGDPVEHSVSPQMHNAAFQAAGLNLLYLSFKVINTHLEEAVRGLKALKVRGCNVTVPHKTAIIKLLDRLDHSAEQVGAVNTVLQSKGQLIGYNTDGIGFVKAIGEDALNKKNIVVVGAGGAAKAITYEAAQRADSLIILNRTLSKAERLMDTVSQTLNTSTKNLKINVLPLNQKSLNDAMKRCHVLINTTSIGLYPHSEVTPIPLKFLRSEMTVFDVIYNPLKTKLLLDAESIGARIISGSDMLLYQGAEAFTIWTRLPPPLKVMRKAMLESLSLTMYPHKSRGSLG